MEITFLEKFSIGSNLRAAASELDWPPMQEYREMMEEFHTTFSTPVRGSLLEDIVPINAPSTSMDDAPNLTLDEEEYQLLLERINHDIPDPMARYTHWTQNDSPLSLLSQNARRLNSLKVDNVEYAPPRKNKGNSFVLTRFSDPASNRHAVVPAQIHSVFLHSRRLPDGTDVVEPFVVVHDYVPLSGEDQTKDPYLVYPSLETRLYYNSFNPHSRVLKQVDIICHFASYVYEPGNMVGERGEKKPCIVVSSLDRS